MENGSQPALIVVGWLGRARVIQEVIRTELSRNLRKRTRRLPEIEKTPKIPGGPCICKSERTLFDIENTFDEFQNAAEIVLVNVVDVVLRRIGRGNNQWHSETVLVIALIAAQD